MGTRADFYVGKGKDAEWLGSIAWDGMDISGYIRAAKKPETFRKTVQVFLSKRDDATLPAMGWPWPWDSSDTTDCSYWFFDGYCWEAWPRGAQEVYTRSDWKRDKDGELPAALLASAEIIEFPNMSHLKKVTLGKRSGVIVFSPSPEAARSDE